MPNVHGNLTGLKASELKSLGHLYRRKLLPDQIVSAELARNLCELSLRIGRQVGVLVDRRGSVTHVIAGDSRKLFIPELGRARAGSKRFRGLRLLHTHLHGEPLSSDDLTDLSLLRLDLVAAIQVGETGLPGTLEYATLLPPDRLAAAAQSSEGDVEAPPKRAPRAQPSNQPWRREGPLRVHELRENFLELIVALEGEFTKAKATSGDADNRPRTILVGVQEGRGDGVDRRMAELARLADTAGLQVIDEVIQRRPKVDPRTLLGKGRLESLLVRSMYLEAELLVFDRDLNPSQGKTIADRTELKVIDRTQLILDIFAQHAHSRDGRLQVELAQLRYLLPRLHLMQQSLSRLTGGIGGRGPGETKLEIRGRRARDRIASLARQLKDLEKKRQLRRSKRQQSGVPVVAILGYTNAGKSTLLNALCRSDVLAEDQLFATLDTTTRRMRFPSRRELVLTDTVGFIEHLPKDLLNAFKATLEELHDADLLLHVIDAADPDRDLHIQVVEDVIEELELDGLPTLRVLNQVDRLEDDEVSESLRDLGGVPVSALEGVGLDALMEELEHVLWRQGHGDVRPAYLIP
ncbi:MAG TPA: GTPase HflX [Deltaproteobacteria bacterium]|nr:GTPase HflX [Deltaproteobacteria bacterium]HCP46399.1 GTPase HflX [Deltaproteobacteria bacterium]